MRKHVSILFSFLILTGSASALELGLAPAGAMGERFESNHSGTPMRKYYLLGQTQPSLKTWLVDAEGKTQPLSLTPSEVGPFVLYKAGWGDSPFHGVNQVIATQTLADGSTETAKFLNVHHNCAWGHTHKFEPERIALQPVTELPLDIQLKPLWDGNYHIQSHAGDEVELTALRFGQPQSGVMIEVITEQGWFKRILTDSQGKARFQLIRDYYTSEWSQLHASHQGLLQIRAHYEEAGKKHSFNMDWRYQLTEADYQSEVLGAGILAGSLLVMGGLVFGVRAFKRKQRRYED